MAEIRRIQAVPNTPARKKRVAAYARVSMESDNLLNSLSNQISNYSTLIQSRSDWDYAGVYSDCGITGTSTAHRDEFQRMIRDCEAGRIDLVLTKSISRFARNTVDLLETVRHLKEIGVEVYFEEQNIYTFDSKGELLITIMSSLAQEEAHNISDNTKWGRRKGFADGKVSVSYSTFLGYDKGPNGEMVVNPEQAETVKKIYQWFLDGLSCCAISKRLTEMGIKTPKDQWGKSTVASILRNEKYKGDALLQKTYVEDFMTKKSIKNDGSKVPQYYVTGNHEAIIDPDMFDLVQAEMKKRMEKRHEYRGVSIFSSRIVCGDCGGWYGAKVWHSNNARYKKTVYRCNHKYDGDQKCGTPALSEYKVKQLFVTALNQLIADRDSIIAKDEILLASLKDTASTEQQIEELLSRMESLHEAIQTHVEKNSRTAMNQAEYQERYEELVSKFDSVKKEHDELQEQLDDSRTRAEKIRNFVSNLKGIENTENTENTVEDFDPQLWCSLVDHMTVYSEQDIRVTFKDGTEIQAGSQEDRQDKQ